MYFVNNINFTEFVIVLRNQQYFNGINKMVLNSKRFVMESVGVVWNRLDVDGISKIYRIGMILLELKIFHGIYKKYGTNKICIEISGLTWNQYDFNLIHEICFEPCRFW